MENENYLNEDIYTKTIDKEKIPKSRSRKSKEEFKEQICEIINYNTHTKTLDIRFKGYGIRIRNADLFHPDNGEITVKYKGEIGKPNFTIKM